MKDFNTPYFLSCNPSAQQHKDCGYLQILFMYRKEEQPEMQNLLMTVNIREVLSLTLRTNCPLSRDLDIFLIKLLKQTLNRLKLVGRDGILSCTSTLQGGNTQAA